MTIWVIVLNVCKVIPYFHLNVNNILDVFKWTKIYVFNVKVVLCCKADFVTLNYLIVKFMMNKVIYVNSVINIATMYKDNVIVFKTV